MHRSLIAFGAACLLGAPIAACDRPSAEARIVGGAAREGETPANDRKVRVLVRPPLATADFEDLALPGTLYAWETASLYSRVTGYLDSVFVEIGDRVDGDTELARIGVPEMRADLDRAGSRVAQEQAELDLARLTRKRLQGLHDQSPEAIPEQEVDIAVAQEKIEAAQLGIARADHDRLKTLSTFARLRAPFPGRITKRVLDPGALAREGTTSDALPILEIARTDRLRLRFDVPESMTPHVSPGTPVQVRFDADPGRALSAVIARLSGALDPSTRSMQAEIDVDNEDDRYRPGMYGSIRIRVRVEAKDAGLIVPSPAVRGGGDDRYCLVVREGVLVEVPVVVSSDDGRLARIAKGIDPLDRVVVASPPLARAGMRVEAVEEEESS